MPHDAPGGNLAGDFSLETLEIVVPATLDGCAVPIRRWIWENWIPVGAVTALYGDGGTGKSLLAQQLMTAVATGRAFLGNSVEVCKAFGLFCEDDDDELHRRQAAINASLGVSFGQLVNMRWLSRVGSENLLMTFGADGRGVPTPFFHQIMNAANDFGARLVIIDTAADTFAGNENIRPQVRQFIALLTRLAREIDGAVVLLAHPSQTGKTTGSGEGGSTAWNNSVRSRLYFKHPESAGGEAPDPAQRKLSRLKANYAATGTALPLRYEAGAFVPDPEAAGASHGQGASRQREAEEAFMAGLNDLLAKGMRCNHHKGQANYAPKAIREKTSACATFLENELTNAMNRLFRSGRIESVEEGPPTRKRSSLRVIAPDLPGM